LTKSKPILFVLAIVLSLLAWIGYVWLSQIMNNNIYPETTAIDKNILLIFQPF